MTTFTQATTNPTTIEVGIEYYMHTDALHWIPNGFQMVNCVVDADELEDDRYATLDEVAEQFCKSIDVVFSQVIESDLW